MKIMIAKGITELVKVAFQIVCDKGIPKDYQYPKKWDIPTVNPHFPKLDIGKLEFPDILIIR